MAIIGSINYAGLQTGNAGNPGAFDIITATSHDLGGEIVAAFESLDAAGGTFAAMEEETAIRYAGKEGVSTPVAAKYLTYTYPWGTTFEGRYTLLTPSAGCTFKVWFLK